MQDVFLALSAYIYTYTVNDGAEQMCTFFHMRIGLARIDMCVYVCVKTDEFTGIYHYMHVSPHIAGETLY